MPVVVVWLTLAARIIWSATSNAETLDNIEGLLTALAVLTIPVSAGVGKVFEDPELPSRLGLAVSRRVGPAVTRSLVKRRFREIFRALSPEFSGSIDLVVIARKGVDRVPFSELKQQFAHALRAWRDVSHLRVNG